MIFYLIRLVNASKVEENEVEYTVESVDKLKNDSIMSYRELVIFRI